MFVFFGFSLVCFFVSLFVCLLVCFSLFVCLVLGSFVSSPFLLDSSILVLYSTDGEKGD